MAGGIFSSQIFLKIIKEIEILLTCPLPQSRDKLLEMPLRVRISTPEMSGEIFLFPNKRPSGSRIIVSEVKLISIV